MILYKNNIDTSKMVNVDSEVLHLAQNRSYGSSHKKTTKLMITDHSSPNEHVSLDTIFHTFMHTIPLSINSEIISLSIIKKHYLNRLIKFVSLLRNKNNVFDLLLNTKM